MLLILYDFITGIFELFLGTSILILGKDLLLQYQQGAISELIEDSHYIFAAYLEKLFPFVLSHSHYIAYLLIATAIVKLISGFGLTRGKEWGVDLLIGLIVLQIPFDLINLTGHLSIYKFIFLAFHLLLVYYLTEYRPHEYFHHKYHQYKSRR